MRFFNTLNVFNSKKVKLNFKNIVGICIILKLAFTETLHPKILD